MREVSRREVGLVLLGASLLAMAMHWPLPLHLGRDIPRDFGDPLGQAWQVAWIGHAILHQPDELFQANIYYPLHNSLATTDVLFGYAPAGLIGTGSKAALVRYDILFLFAYFLAFVGAYLLSRELGVGPAAAAVAGVAFAYAPWRLGQDPSLNILSSGGVPLAVFLLLRGYRRQSSWTVLAGWLAAVWQLLLGINLGLQLAYLLLVLGAIAAVYWYRRRPALRRGVIVASAVGIGGVLLVTGWLARPYLQVRDDHPEARRTIDDVEAFSPGIEAFLHVPSGNLIRGAEPRGLGETLAAREHALFPGAVILALAALGAFAPVYPRRWRVAAVLAILALVALSLGYVSERSIVVQPFKLARDYLPGWDAIRAPSRINTLTSLGLALLAAAGAQQLLISVERRTAFRGLLIGLIPSVVATALVVAILLEGSGFQFRDGGLRAPRHPSVPPPPSGQLGATEPQLHLPYAYSYPFGDSDLYVYWSTDGFPKMANGWGGFLPKSDVALEQDSLGFPDGASVARLRARGIRTVVFHPDLAPGTEWAHVAKAPVRGLPLRREVRGDVVLFHLDPEAGQ